ncbi:MAG: DUF4139 domain-containing protein [Polyangiaceae bacterium]
MAVRPLGPMLEIASRIERVRVGRAHAEVTRVLDVEAGSSADGATLRLPDRFVIPNLTLALEDASVRVLVDGGDGVRVRSARVTLVATDHGRTDDGAEAAVREAEQALALARRLAAICEASMAAIRSVPWVERPRGKRGEAPVFSPIEARMALAHLQRERGTELADELVKRRAAVTLAEKQHSEALARHAQASSARAPRSDELRKAVVVDLDGGGATKARLELSYVVPGARWMPAYTLRIEGGAASLQLRALVQQNTGEDWTRVALSLSTADAERATELPELQSARIGRAQPKRRTGFRAPPVGAAELYADYAAILAKRPEPPPAPPPPSPASTTAFAMDALLSEDRDEREDDLVSANMAEAPAGGGGASPPMPGPARGAPAAPFMVQPQAAMPHRHRASRSFDRGLLEQTLVGALGGAAKKKAMDARAPAPPEGAAAPAPIEVDARALAFGSLRMPAPDSPSRGELARVGVGELYAEVAVDVSLSISASVTLSAALHGAANPWLAPPPARHALPASFSGFDFSFEADAPIDLPSDGEPHAVALSTASAPAKVFHVVVPRESRDVFRCLEVTSPLDAPLLAGPLDVYEGRDFLLSTDLATTPPRGILRVGLGVDSAVKVARNIEFGETITGLMRGSLDLWHKVACEITNGRRDVIRVDVRERVPTTLREKDVKVEVVRVEPMWKGYEDPTHPIQGGHVWQIDLAPGEKRTCHLEYVVHIAAKHELAGGNRREE